MRRLYTVLSTATRQYTKRTNYGNEEITRAIVINPTTPDACIVPTITPHPTADIRQPFRIYQLPKLRRPCKTIGPF